MTGIIVIIPNVISTIANILSAICLLATLACHTDMLKLIYIAIMVPMNTGTASVKINNAHPNAQIIVITIPNIEKIMTLKELTNNKKDINLICSLNDKTKPLSTFLTDDVKEILFVIGPEGGFSKKEEEFLIANGFDCTTLGKRVLRVETAAICVASIINYIYEG